ncbi:MAG: hypothetical protein ACTFAL_16355 [Candidatus Electronema sp. V4]|uniref:hypothetical protein n=1 Tax=Candidatus Electronema sp. V4 TaxID=3454756 RepID=UPI0040555EB2
MTYKPLAQLNELRIQEFLDELIVCDSNNDRAHCLNPFAASVFKLCDGTRTIDEIKNELQEDESSVWQAIYELSESGIVTKPPESLVETDFSRRRIVKMVGVGILVYSISLPTPEAAASILLAGCGCGNTQCTSCYAIPPQE